MMNNGAEWIRLSMRTLRTCCYFSDEEVGRGMRAAALQCCRQQAPGELHGFSQALCDDLVESVQMSNEDYEKRCRQNRINGAKNRPKSRKVMAAMAEESETEPMGTESLPIEENRINRTEGTEQREREYGPSRPRDVQEVEAYCREKGLQVDAVKFFEHFESGGWMRNGEPIRDWKARLRFWAHEDKQRAKPTPPPVQTQPEGPRRAKASPIALQSMQRMLAEEEENEDALADTIPF